MSKNVCLFYHFFVICGGCGVVLFSDFYVLVLFSFEIE